MTRAGIEFEAAKAKALALQAEHGGTYGVIRNMAGNLKALNMKQVGERDPVLYITPKMRDDTRYEHAKCSTCGCTYQRIDFHGAPHVYFCTKPQAVQQ